MVGVIKCYTFDYIFYLIGKKNCHEKEICKNLSIYNILIKKLNYSIFFSCFIVTNKNEFGRNRIRLIEKVITIKLELHGLYYLK
jgi:hypothetical protein